MPTIITDGAASAQGYGYAGVKKAANYIEDVFSTYLYTGTGASQTISNGVDLSTKGGMVWIKSRSAATNNFLFDTSRGTTKEINSNTTDAEATLANSLTAFNTDGFTVNSATGIGVNAATYVSWTFRKQAKFFDVVSFSTDGSGAATFSHSLGSTPGCIFIKRTNGVEQWYVYHRSLTNPNNYYLGLNTTSGETNVGFSWITVSGTSCSINGLFSTSSTYVAYLFAHDAGGFGASGTDNVISCGEVGTFGNDVNLGYEPQFIIFKCISRAEDWFIYDTMRGFTYTVNGVYSLSPNVSSAEVQNGYFQPITNGFKKNLSGTYIYIAIRLGPMKTPTSGTSVYEALTYAGDGSAGTGQTLTTAFPMDFAFTRYNRSSTGDWDAISRLQGLSTTANSSRYLNPHNTNVEATGGFLWQTSQTQLKIYGFSASTTELNYFFRRAPGFFDVVCYTGTGASATLNHNLGVAPNMVIVKGRSVISNWETYLSSLGGTSGNGLALNDPGAKTGTPPVSSATATTFTLNNGVSTSSGQTYVAYLFATLSGVSKVGSYTGTGTTKQIDCGFTGGARFVLIKRTDSTGDWYVWDSARGIVAGNDPYLLLNSTAAEVTGTDYVDTYSAGFEISSTAPAAINANGGSFIFLAIA